MTQNAPTLETDEREITKLVPADDASSGRFETARYSDDGDPDGVATEAATATVSGRVLAAIPATVVKMSGSFEQFTWRLLEDAGTGRVDEHDWYAQETVMEVFATLQATVGDQVVERVGRFLPELLDWPEDVTTLVGAFEAVDDWYRTVNRDDATIAFTRTGPAGGELRLATPYPSSFEVGLARGLVQRFGDAESHVRTAATTNADGETVYEFVILSETERTA